MELKMIAIFVGIFIIMFIIYILISNNRKLKKDARQLYEILALKEQTITNYEASRVAVKDVIDNFLSINKVMALIKQGKSREAISDELDIPIEKIELIIKLNRLKDDHKS